jgi:hypothetical protein
VPTAFAGLIQSDFGDPDHPNFEAAILNGDELWHYWRDNHPGRVAWPPFPWKPGKRICTGAMHAGAIIQSHFKFGQTGNFEVVVPKKGTNGHAELWHFQHDNQDLGSDWRPIQRITAENDQVLWPASIIQSDFGEQHNFEVVVPISGPNGRGELWHFFHDNLRPGPWGRAKRVTQEGDVVVGPGSIIQGSRGPDRNNFEVVVPILGPDGKPDLWHYFHDNSNLGSEWVKAKRVTGPADSAASGGVILESDFGDREHGDFEVVVPLLMPQGHTELRHFWHDADPATEWRRGDLITASARGGVAFARSNFHSGNHRNFEVLVEECKHSSIVHYFRHNESVDNPWLRTGPILDWPLLRGEEVEDLYFIADTKKICQLTGEFDLEGWDNVVLGDTSPMGPALASHLGRLFLAWKGGGNDNLNLMASDDDGGTFPVKKTFADATDNPPALARHGQRLLLAWKGSGNENLNVAKVILFANTTGGFGIEGLEDKVTLGETSNRGPSLASHAGRLFLAWKGANNDALNLTFSDDGGLTFRGKVTLGETSEEAPALASHGGRLFLAWRGSGNENLTVAKVALLSSTVGGFGIEGLEDKVTLGETSPQSPALASHAGRLFLAWKGSGNTGLNIAVSDDNGATFHGKPRVPEATDCPMAVTSQVNSQGDSLFWAWKGAGNENLYVARYRAPKAPTLTENPFGSAHNRTETQPGIRGIRGVDLGSSFMHNGRICFLFGDTMRIDQITEDGKNLHSSDFNFDAVAFCPADANPDNGLSLTFNSGPPVIGGGLVEQKDFDVPLDGVSFRGSMFVFFSDKSRQVTEYYPLMGRSVVARSDNDGNDFVFLREFSGKKFINVTLDAADGDQIGLPTFGKTLLIWGSGRYRSSDVYLAAMPLEEIASGRFVRYYAGQRGETPIWATDEEEAAPLFPEACVGELSVRWNPFVNRWLILYNSDNPWGIHLRSAERPWGPWSEPVIVFRGDGTKTDGVGKFLHRPFSEPGRRDWQYDRLQHDPKDRPNEGGTIYGPYLIAPLARGVPGVSTDIFFTLSTWNPYQSVLMRTTLKVGGRELRARTKIAVVPRLEIRGRTPF